MKASELRKNVPKSVRVNDKVLQFIKEELGLSLQEFLDKALDEKVTLKLEAK